jgi:hypothetical protein
VEFTALLTASLTFKMKVGFGDELPLLFSDGGPETIGRNLIVIGNTFRSKDTFLTLNILNLKEVNQNKRK